MSEFQIISNLLREKCDESEETQQLCKQIASKYMENEKRKWRAQSVLEENIRLKIEVGNLESICRTVMQNNDAQAELNSLLKEYYEEHLKASFDIDECEMEKLLSYEEIKIELETRDSVAMYQQFYWRKINLATKMENRKIVKKYRQIEQELFKSEDERLKLEEAIKNLRVKAEEEKIRMKELLECIYRLVKGSKDLDIIYSHQKTFRYRSQDGNLIKAGRDRLLNIVERAPDQLLHKGGFSSRISMNFDQFKMPFAPVLPKIRTINSSMGLSRLLQQSEALRKSMQSSVIPLPDNTSIPNLPSILKMPAELTNSSQLSNTYKSVSFESNRPQEIKVCDNVTQITLDTNISETTVDSDVTNTLNKNTKVEAKKTKINIIEDVIIKPPNSLLPFQISAAVPKPQLSKEKQPEIPTDQKMTNKRKSVDEDHSYALNSQPKKVRSDLQTLDNSMDLGSKSFMEMFLNFSKGTPTTSLSTGELKTIQGNVKIEKKEDEKKKVKKPKAAFDDFEDFFSSLAGNNSDTNDNDQLPTDMSFDFFEGGNENADDDAGSDNFSLKF